MISYNKCIIDFIRKNDIKSIEEILNNTTYKPDYVNNRAFCMAAKLGRYYIVQLFLNDSRFHPSESFKGMVLIDACREGHLDVIKLLLNDSRVNPSDNNSRALLVSIENDHFNIFKLLIEDGRSKFNVSQNAPIMICSLNTNLNDKYIKMLWAIDEVKKTLNNDYPALFELLSIKDLKQKIKIF